jgi:hypothetical protein
MRHTGDQTTAYTYGTTTSSSGVATGELLSSVSYPGSAGEYGLTLLVSESLKGDFV